jgi:hypothetical protein
MEMKEYEIMATSKRGDIPSAGTRCTFTGGLENGAKGM